MFVRTHYPLFLKSLQNLLDFEHIAPETFLEGHRHEDLMFFLHCLSVASTLFTFLGSHCHVERFENSEQKNYDINLKSFK